MIKKRKSSTEEFSIKQEVLRDFKYTNGGANTGMDSEQTACLHPLQHTMPYKHKPQDTN